MNESEPQKEDHLSPTRIPSKQNKDAAKGSIPELSHEELPNRLDSYSMVNLGEEMDHHFKQQRLKADYLKEMNKRKETRTQQDKSYSDGERTGLPQPSYQRVNDNHEHYDKKLRDQVIKEAKEAYRANNSTTKVFGEQNKEPTIPESKSVVIEFSKSKNKGVDKER